MIEVLCEHEMFGMIWLTFSVNFHQFKRFSVIVFQNYISHHKRTNFRFLID